MSLEARLRERIQREGPISFYEWMKTALYDERQGYYCADRVRQGRGGDYRTAPETSPLFAATFTNYFAKLFEELGSPDEFTIIEIGAGGGEFAQGVLATLQSEHPEVFVATNYLIDEISEASGARCAARLDEFSGRVSVRSPTVREGQFERVALPDGRASDTITGIIFSNELIDAFPVNRVVMSSDGLRQLYVGWRDERFVWVEADLEQPVANYCKRIALDLREGQIAEINLDAEAFIARAAASLQRGYVVTVDYGAERGELLNALERPQGSLRAFHSHQFADDVLANAGKQDLTTTIDWTQITEAGERFGLPAHRFERLDRFLIAEGLLDRLAQIAETAADTSRALQLANSARELIMPDAMAASFQVLVQKKSA
ncbi:MAG TPA: SAM-dependent methyltransferase [Pyrinomonadaceae bacterium]|nr:SAM-dependent methyltransferase [Pyrinomonadaceae bacterium]